jgi:hypothetical protein
MKKYLIIIFIVIAFLSNISLLHANKNNELTVKMGYGYSTQQNNFYDNDFTVGINYDLGNFLIPNMQFKPGFDVFFLSTQNDRDGALFSIHSDWYYYQNLNQNKFLGFLGFAPSLNFYVNDTNPDKNYTSIGVDLFCGLEYWFNTKFALNSELRESITDIMNLKRDITKIYLGCSYKF